MSKSLSLAFLTGLIIIVAVATLVSTSSIRKQNQEHDSVLRSRQLDSTHSISVVTLDGGSAEYVKHQPGQTEEIGFDGGLTSALTWGLLDGGGGRYRIEAGKIYKLACPREAVLGGNGCVVSQPVYILPVLFVAIRERVKKEHPELFVDAQS